MLLISVEIGFLELVTGFGVEWPYGERPVLVASHRELGPDSPRTVRRVEGPIEELVVQAKQAAAGRDVYLDGGVLIRQACEAGLVDELVISFAPTALGAGHPLFAGLLSPYRMRFADIQPHPGGMLQVRMVPEAGSQGS